MRRLVHNPRAKTPRRHIQPSRAKLREMQQSARRTRNAPPQNGYLVAQGAGRPPDACAGPEELCGKLVIERSTNQRARPEMQKSMPRTEQSAKQRMRSEKRSQPHPQTTAPRLHFATAKPATTRGRWRSLEVPSTTKISADLAPQGLALPPVPTLLRHRCRPKYLYLKGSPAPMALW